MQGFLTKPNEKDKLLKTLADIQKVETKAIEEIPLVEPKTTIDEKQILDIAICRKNASGSESLVNKLLGTFIKKLPEYLTEFAGYYADENIKYLGLLAHKLKGAAVTVGAPRLAAATEELQHIAEVKKVTMEDVEESYRKVRAEIEEVILVLKKLGY